METRRQRDDTVHFINAGKKKAINQETYGTTELIQKWGQSKTLQKLKARES